MSPVGQRRKPKALKGALPRAGRLCALTVSGLILAAISIAVNGKTFFRWYCLALPLPALAASVGNKPDPVGVPVLARRYLQAGRPADAEQILRPLLDRHPEHSEAWLLRSRAEFDQSEFGPAYASLQVARAGLPPDAEVRFLLGQLQERRGNENAAEKEYLAALDVNPRHPGALMELGRIELMHLQYGGALSHLTAARKVAPRKPELLQLLAQTYQALGNSREAEAAARESILASPNSGRGWYVLGEVLKTSISADKRSEARDAFEKALELEPALVVAHHELGVLHLQAQDLAAAVGEFETVLRTLPLHKQTYPFLARCYLRLSRKQDAARVLKEYERLDAMDLDTAPLEYSLWAMPKNVALRIKLARRYVRYGREDLAEAQVALALEVNPGHRDALLLRDELRKSP